MRIFIYAIVAFLFNYILFQSFPFGQGGTGLGVLITVSIICAATMAAMGIHYYYRKKGHAGYFQWIVIAGLFLLSYFLFITAPDNSPADIIKRMRRVAKEYHEIELNDYFLDPYYYNYERIVAAKKKYNDEISDTAFSVRIANAYDYDKEIERYGIMYFNDRPSCTNGRLLITKIAVDTFKFQENIGSDTIVFYGSRSYISKPINISDTFLGKGIPYPGNTSILRAEMD